MLALAMQAQPQSHRVLTRSSAGVSVMPDVAAASHRWSMSSRAALALAAMGAVAVFWAFDALPFMDLPAHAGLIALRQRFASSPFDQQLYVLAPHVGAYSLFRFLGDGFARVVGPVGAVRMLATISVLALPLAIVDARRRLHGRVSAGFGFLGLTLGFGLMTLFGFASFLLGVAVLVECTALWLVLSSSADRVGGMRTGWRLELAVALVALLLFVTHGFAFVLFLGIVGVTVVVGPHRKVRALHLRALAPAVSLAAYAAWMERASSLPLGSVAVPQPRTGLLFPTALEKVSLLATPTLMTRTGVDIVVGMLVWGVAILGVVATVGWLRRRGGDDAATRVAAGHARALLACVLLLACAFVIVPHEVGWFGFVDGRLVLVVLVLATLAVPMAAIGRMLTFAHERIMPPLATVIVLLALVTSYRFQDEARGYREVLARVPTYARVLNVPIDPNSDVFTGHPFVHYDKLVLAERPVLVSDVWLHQGSALFPRAGNPILRLPRDYLSSDIRAVDWSAFVLPDWDYVLVRTKPSAPAPVVPDSMRVVEHVGGWWLYSTQWI